MSRSVSSLLTAQLFQDGPQLVHAGGPVGHGLVDQDPLGGQGVRSSWARWRRSGAGCRTTGPGGPAWHRTCRPALELVMRTFQVDPVVQRLLGEPPGRLGDGCTGRSTRPATHQPSPSEAMVMKPSARPDSTSRLLRVWAWLTATVCLRRCNRRRPVGAAPAGPAPRPIPTRCRRTRYRPAPA